MLKNLIIGFIKLYQHTLSPDTGWFKHRHSAGYCKYYPSCSEYGRQVIERYGVVQGIPKAVWRVMRCNPWSHGGLDEVK